MDILGLHLAEFTLVFVSVVVLIGGGYLAWVGRQEDNTSREKQRDMNT